MHYVYILISKKDGKFYTGSTNDLKRRFDEHNGGKVESTRGLKNSLYFGFYNFQKFFKKGEAKLTSNYRLKPLQSLRTGCISAPQAA